MGGNAEKALGYAEEAADRGMGMLVYEAAVSHYEDALAASALPAFNPACRTDLLLQLGDARVAAAISRRRELRSRKPPSSPGRTNAPSSSHAPRSDSGPGQPASRSPSSTMPSSHSSKKRSKGSTTATRRSRVVLARLSVAAGLGGSDPNRRERAEHAIEMVRDADEPAAFGMPSRRIATRSPGPFTRSDDSKRQPRSSRWPDRAAILVWSCWAGEFGSSHSSSSAR